MGKGIGSIINWIFVIKKNNVFFEIGGELTFPLWILLKKSKNKLPFLSTIIFRKKLKKK
jgi:ribosomal protein L16/L10AE